MLEQALFRAGLPDKIYGGLRFTERQEIKHALAYLRLAVNPHDDNALLRVINMPTRGIGTRTIETIQIGRRRARHLAVAGRLRHGRQSRQSGCICAPD